MDRAASRFRSDSELSRVHRAGGNPVVVSDGLLEAVRVALGAATATDGAVDPTVGPALCRLGYDRDFADVVGGRRGALPEPHPVPGWRAVEIDETRGTVRLPPGVELDLGATAKALASDRVADRVARTGRGRR
ncbi:MAG TPA: FAD:protein FMN transferase [Acidimicrobiales bacterium]